MSLIFWYLLVGIYLPQSEIARYLDWHIASTKESEVSGSLSHLGLMRLNLCYDMLKKRCWGRAGYVRRSIGQSGCKGRFSTYVTFNDTYAGYCDQLARKQMLTDLGGYISVSSSPPPKPKPPQLSDDRASTTDVVRYLHTERSQRSFDNNSATMIHQATQLFQSDRHERPGPHWLGIFSVPLLSAPSRRHHPHETITNLWKANDTALAMLVTHIKNENRRTQHQLGPSLQSYA